MTKLTHAELVKAIREYNRPVSRAVAPAPFNFNPEGTPLEQEDQVINYFFDNWTTNPKKLTKMAKRLYPSTPKFICKSILDNVLARDVDPVNYLRRCFDEKAQWAVIIPQLLAAGFHGMIYDGSQVHGFSVNAQKNWLTRKDKWTKDDEMDILGEAAEMWAEANEVDEFTHKIMLFPEFGFSGMPYKLNSHNKGSK